MDRQIIYPGAIPLETDLLNTNKYAMIGLSKLAAGILGVSTFLNGLACTPTGPASLQVNVAPGEIYSLQNVDGTAYSSIAADTTHAILKQGISLDQLTLSCPAPGTAGQSVNYLIQVAYQDTDSGSTVLPYYNASNPSQAYSGPANSGTSQNTVRKGVCAVSAKAGVAATTGSQTTPAPDAGYIGAFVVTVANGQTQILAGNISTYAGAPFLPSAGLVVGGLQGNACNISAAGGTADAITGAYFPGITALTNGMTLYVRAGSANATTTPTFTPNSGVIAAKQIVKGAGAALAAGDIAGGGHWIELQYDATLDKWVLLNPATGVSPQPTASIQAAFTNLKGSAPGTSAIVSYTADEIVTGDGAGNYQSTRSWNSTITMTSAGAGGLDTGTVAANTWYYAFAITKPDGTKALLASLSATAPTLPSGYTKWARIGAIRTDGTANKYPLSFQQYGRRTQYKVASGSNVASLPVMASGITGTWSATAPTWAAVAVGAFVPPTASRIALNLTGIYNNGTASNAMAAPNNAYSGSATTNPPPISTAMSGATSLYGISGEFALESTNIYFVSQSAGGAVLCFGWEDNI